jgi:hypothetical protein
MKLRAVAIRRTTDERLADPLDELAIALAENRKAGKSSELPVRWFRRRSLGGPTVRHSTPPRRDFEFEGDTVLQRANMLGLTAPFSAIPVEHSMSTSDVTARSLQQTGADRSGAVITIMMPVPAKSTE